MSFLYLFISNMCLLYINVIEMHLTDSLFSRARRAVIGQVDEEKDKSQDFSKIAADPLKAVVH